MTMTPSSLKLRPVDQVVVGAAMVVEVDVAVEETATLDPSSAATKFKMYVLLYKTRDIAIVVADLLGCVG